MSTVVGAALALGALLLLVPGLVLLRQAPLRVTELTVPLFATLTLLWPVFAVAAFGVDQALAPSRFALLPVRAARLAPGLFVAALLGVPAVFTVALALGQVGAWTSRPAAAVAALVAAVLGVTTAVLLARVTTLALATVMSTRRGRELGAVLVSLVTLAPMGLSLLAGRGGLRGDLDRFDAGPAARAAGVTPVGWAWALPADVAHARWGELVGHLVAAVALIGVLWWLWVGRIERALTSPAVTGGGQHIGSGRLLPRLLGPSPTAAVAIRRIRAWRRDSRLVSIAIRTALFPVILIGQAVVSPAGAGYAGMGALSLAILSGLTLMNDLAFDGPAWWVHLATGVQGRADRLGRCIASAVVFGPVTLIAYVVVVALGLVGDPVLWLALVLTALPASLGVAGLVGAYLPGTAPKTGGNPFAAQSGAAAQGCLTALVSMVTPAVLLLPVLLLGWLTHGLGAGRLLLPVVALAWGLGLCAAGVVLGGRRLDARGPEMLVLLREAQS